VVLYGHPFRCWKRGGHGFVDLERSLAESCDVYYYLLGQRLGIEKMAEWLSRFGFGQPTGLDPAFESSGLVGTPEWSRRVRKTPWYPGEAVSVSIGQGPLLTTVLQLARAYAVLANGGRDVTPHLIPGDAPVAGDRWVRTEDLRVVNHGLFEVVHGASGTARRLAFMPIAGKTGTAQVARLQEGKKQEDLARELRHHALFVGWAPLEAPRLVVAVVVEHGGDGGSVAAPVAGRIIETFLAQSGTATSATDPGPDRRSARLELP
jgi:penicillin-binding protein 2